LVDTSLFGSAWKYGYGQLATASILLLSAKLNVKSFSRPLGIALPFAAATLSLALNARNLFGITALSAVIGVITTVRRRAPSPVQIGTIGLVCVLLGFGLISIYSYAAGEGLIGPEAQEKYRHQSSGNLNLLVAGRTESLGSTQAIVDSPILGHGSWARDMTYVQDMLSKLQEAGIESEGGEGYYGGDVIPTHSHLLGAWVEAGILGAVFWFWALWLAICAVYAAIRAPFSTTSFIVFIGLSLVWDIFFSPFAHQRRIITPAWLYLMMLVIERANEKLDRMRLEG
jgi:O-antigen ligase